MVAKPIRKIMLGVFATACVLQLGCGGRTDGRVKVTGNVTLDSEPVPRGRVSFTPEDGKGEPGAAGISDGKYEAYVTPGRNRVKVSMFQDAGPGEEPPADSKAARRGRMDEMRGKAKLAKGVQTVPYLVGNDQVHDIKPEGGSLDIPLQSSGGRGR